MADTPLVANLDESGKRRRFYIGIFLFDVGLLGAILMIVLGLPKWWRLTLALPFLIGFLCLFQARGNC